MPKLNNEYICVCIHSYLLVYIYNIHISVCVIYILRANIVLIKFMHPSSISSIILLYEHICKKYLVGYYSFPTAAKGGAAFFPRDATVDIMQLMIWGLNGLTDIASFTALSNASAVSTYTPFAPKAVAKPS